MNWKAILPWVLLVIAAIFIVVKTVIPSRVSNDNYWRDLAWKEREERLKTEQELRKEIKADFQKQIADIKARDSVNDARLKSNKIIREKIPVIVNAYSDDELDAAVAEFDRTH